LFHQLFPGPARLGQLLLDRGQYGAYRRKRHVAKGKFALNPASGNNLLLEILAKFWKNDGTVFP
jgi:hypothetical protein